MAQPTLLALFLFFFFWQTETFRNSLANWWHLLTVSAGVAGLYLLVHVEGRYIAACLVFVWLLVFCALRLPHDSKSRLLATSAVFAAVIAMLLSLTRDIAKPLLHGCPESARAHVQLAQVLDLAPGTPVAVIGAGNFCYWAHLSGVRIIAEIMQMDEGRFWSLAAPEQDKFFAAFRSTGAQWLIAQPPADLLATLSDKWQPISTTSYYRRSLMRTSEATTSAAQR
jgi:hypothetical protein